MGIPPSIPELRHRALGHRSRIELLTRLRACVDGEDADTLAAATGLHVNTVRGHLRVLEEAGLVSSAPERRRRPGRPRLRFVAIEPPRQLDEGDYRSLAALLAETLADASSDPAASAVRTGERLGRTLADAPARPTHEPSTATGMGTDEGAGPSTIRAAAVALLDRLGFAPRPVDGDPRRLELRRCPYLDVAREHREIVCSLHLGVLRGALAVRGADPDEVGLAPFATPSSCLVTLPA
jgi:predicted ArsR family transcriptional regulator